MFAQAAACIRSEHQRLTELDSVGGDGDHGTTMLRAAEQMELDGAIGHESLTGPSEGCRLEGAERGWRRLQQPAGNVLCGHGRCGACRGCDGLRRPRPGIRGGLARGLQADQGPAGRQDDDGCFGSRRCRCECGCRGRQNHTGGIARMQPCAARLGAESTRDLVARYGRARYLGERTLGHPDAGAISIASLQGIQGRSKQWRILTISQDGKNYYLDSPPRVTSSRSRAATRWIGE